MYAIGLFVFVNIKAERGKTKHLEKLFFYPIFFYFYSLDHCQIFMKTSIQYPWQLGIVGLDAIKFVF